MIKKQKNNCEDRMSGEFAIGIILLISIVIGGLFWIYSKRIEQEMQQAIFLNNKFSDRALESKKIIRKNNDCKAHYYDGETEIDAWISKEKIDNSKYLTVEIIKDDIEKFPVKTIVDNENKNNFIIGVADPDEETLELLKKSSEKDPAKITIRGYAELCQDFPVVSVKKASETFKIE